MSVIQDKANEVAALMEGKKVEHRVAFDPSMIITIIEIISALIGLLRECHSGTKDMADRMRNPGILERWRLRRLAVQHINDDEMHGLVGRELVSCTLDVGAKVTDDDVTAMCAEVG